MRDLFDDIEDIIETDESVVLTCTDADKDEFKKKTKLFEFSLDKIKTTYINNIMVQDPNDQTMSVNTLKEYINYFTSVFYRFDFKVNFSSAHIIENLVIVVSDKYPDADLNFVDTSELKTLKHLFAGRKFNGNIALWNTANVENCESTFAGSEFNGDISEWNMSKVTTMKNMFNNSKFNGDISKWDVSNVFDMEGMFKDSVFNGDISNWRVNNVRNMDFMFFDSAFRGDVSKWKVFNCTSFKETFGALKKRADQWVPNLHKWEICGHCTDISTIWGCDTDFYEKKNKRKFPKLIYHDMPEDYFKGSETTLQARLKETIKYYENYENDCLMLNRHLSGKYTEKGLTKKDNMILTGLSIIMMKLQDAITAEHRDLWDISLR